MRILARLHNLNRLRVLTVSCIVLLLSAVAVLCHYTSVYATVRGGLNKYEDDAIAGCNRGSQYNVARIWINNDTYNPNGRDSGYYSPKVAVSTYDNIVTAYLRGSAISCTSAAPAGHIYAQSVAPKDNITTIQGTSFYRGYTNGSPRNFTTQGGDLVVSLNISSVPLDGAPHTLVASVTRCFYQRLDAGGTSSGSCGPEYIDVEVTRPASSCNWVSVPGSVNAGQNFSVTARVANLQPGFNYALGSGDYYNHGWAGGSTNPDDSAKADNAVWGIGRTHQFNSSNQDVTFTLRAPPVSATRNVGLVFSAVSDSGGFWTRATCAMWVTVVSPPAPKCQFLNIVGQENVANPVMEGGKQYQVQLHIRNEAGPFEPSKGDRFGAIGNDGSWSASKAGYGGRQYPGRNEPDWRDMGSLPHRMPLDNYYWPGWPGYLPPGWEGDVYFTVTAPKNVGIVSKALSWGALREGVQWYPNSECGKTITVVTPANKPYFRSTVNDVVSGASFGKNWPINSPNECRVNADKIGVKTSSFWAGRGYRGGSGSEYATYSAGFIDQDNTNNNMVGYTGANAVPREFISYENNKFFGWNLLFGNAAWGGKYSNSGNGWTDGKYGAFYAGFGNTDWAVNSAKDAPVQVQCMRNYYTEKDNTEAKVLSPNTFTTETGVYKSTFVDQPGRSFSPLGISTVPAGHNTTLLIEGNILINQDIKYTSSPNIFKSPTSLTLIVKGNISIASNVTQIDANLIVQPTGANTGGIIETCGSQQFHDSQKKVDGPCANQLKINGTTVARIMKPLRTFGTLGTTSTVNVNAPDQATPNEAPFTINDYNSSGANTSTLVDRLNGKAAEIFSFDPTSYFATGGASGSGASQSFRELPPVY